MKLFLVPQMPANWLPRHEYLAARARADLAARKAAQEENRDQEIESAVIAYHAHRIGGGGMSWEDFRREWLMTRGGRDGR